MYVAEVRADVCTVRFVGADGRLSSNGSSACSQHKRKYVFLSVSLYLAIVARRRLFPYVLLLAAAVAVSVYDRECIV